MASRILVVDDSPTIRRVVSAILERAGYEPSLASDGEDAFGALVSGEVKADLVLLDFVMPRMNGYQFCRALRDHPELAQTPVVLMSAKGDRIRDQFVVQMGALDAITKPFDAQALVATVENALRRVNEKTRQSSARLPEIEPEEEPAAISDFETRRTHVAQIVAAKLAQITLRAIEEKPDDLAKLLVERLEKDALVEMVEAVRDLDKANKDAVLSGDLAVIPIGAVLQLLQGENQSGVLVCHDGKTEVRATFRAGLIDLVVSSGTADEFRLGRYFVEEDILTPSDVEDFVKRARSAEENPDAPLSRVLVKEGTSGLPTPKDSPSGPLTFRDDPHARVTLPGPSSPRPLEVVELSASRPRLLGTMLLEAGKITEPQLKSALGSQSSELLYDVIRWPRGRFDFRREPSSAPANSARLGLPVASVVMEGFRRVDEWRVLERTLGSFDAVLVRDDAALGSFDVSQLPDRERRVLDAAENERTIRQLIAASHLSSFDACRVLVQLLEARVLRRRTS